jgi:glycosyltransferase involved in cell wall biosynthesis
LTATAPLRVLHLGKYFPPFFGGMETYLADLIQAQRAQGVDAFALVHGDPLPDDPPWLRRVPVQWQLLYAPIAVGYPQALARAIQAFKPDVLHLHMPNNSVFWALLLPAARRLPWVVHWHSDVLVSDTRAALSLAYLAYRPFEQAVLARAHRIAVTSPPYLEASEPLRAWADKCEVVPLGLQAPALAPPLPALSSSITWPSDGAKLRVLSIGRLAHYKGFETLIDAVAQSPDVALLIAGDGELRSALQAQIDAHQQATATPRMRLLGSVTEAEKQHLLAECDLFALPSCERTEAFGMVLLEAMAHGKPCLASALPGSGMPWVVASSQAGRLAPPQDVGAWSQALLWMARHPEQREAMGAAGRAAFDARFTAAASARTLQALYPTPADQPLPAGAPTRTLIVIPARDEAATIGSLLAQLRAAGHTEVLVIDDLSSDGTGDIARAAGARVLRPVLGLGAWGGMQTGIRHALRHGFDTVITMDADGQHEVDELPALLLASTQADVVIGAFPERASALRQIAWRWFRLLTGLNVTDLTSGFRCYRGDALRVLASSEATLLDYQDVGTLLMLRRAGLRVVEVPVRMNERVAGASRIFGSWLKVARYMAITTLLCLSRWRIGPAHTRR